jgi:hypothetical protein
MKLWGQAFRLTQQQFVQTRKDMYDVASTIAGIERQMQWIRKMAARFSPAQQARIQQVDKQWQDLMHRVGSFVQAWLTDKNTLPVIDTIVVKDGIVDPDAYSMTLFATASEADIITLAGYVKELNEWTHDLQSLIDGLPF